MTYMLVDSLDGPVAVEWKEEEDNLDFTIQEMEYPKAPFHATDKEAWRDWRVREYNPLDFTCLDFT